MLRGPSMHNVCPWIIMKSKQSLFVDIAVTVKYQWVFAKVMTSSIKIKDHPVSSYYFVDSFLNGLCKTFFFWKQIFFSRTVKFRCHLWFINQANLLNIQYIFFNKYVFIWIIAPFSHRFIFLYFNKVFKQDELFLRL